MLDEFESSARLLPPEEVKAKEKEVAQASLELLPAENAEVQLLLNLEPAEEKEAVPSSFALAPAEETAEVSPSLTQASDEAKTVVLPAPEVAPTEAKVIALLSAGLPSAEEHTIVQPTSGLATAEEKAVSPSVELPPAEEKAAAMQSPEPPPAQGKVKVRPSLGNKADRPFRVKLRGSVLVLVRLPNKRSVQAAFHQLSTSGGVIHFEKPLDEKLVVELIFHIQKTTIRSKAQLLFPMWATQGWMQPFRFVDLPAASKEILDTNLKTFLGDAAKSAAAGS